MSSFSVCSFILTKSQTSTSCSSSIIIIPGLCCSLAVAYSFLRAHTSSRFAFLFVYYGDESTWALPISITCKTWTIKHKFNRSATHFSPVRERESDIDAMLMDDLIYRWDARENGSPSRQSAGRKVGFSRMLLVEIIRQRIFRETKKFICARSQQNCFVRFSYTAVETIDTRTKVKDVGITLKSTNQHFVRAKRDSRAACSIRKTSFSMRFMRCCRWWLFESRLDNVSAIYYRKDFLD